jgi:hypothetical protein
MLTEEERQDLRGLVSDDLSVSLGCATRNWWTQGNPWHRQMNARTPESLQFAESTIRLRYSVILIMSQMSVSADE